MSTGVRSESLTVDGHRLHYLRAGDAGPPVVLLHGGIIDAAHLSWGAVIEPLSADFRVIAPDFLGYGESDIPDVEYTTAFHVETLECVLDALGLERVTLVGISLGGGVGLGFALAAPDRVDRLVLVDSYGLGTQLPNGIVSYVLAHLPVFNRLSIALLRRSRRLARASLGAIVYDTDCITDDIVDAFYAHLQRPGVGTAFRRWRKHEITRSGYRTVYVDRFEAVTPPTLVLHGAEDDLFPVEWSERAATCIPDAELRVVEECGHWLPREKPDTCIHAITAFLTE